MSPTPYAGWDFAQVIGGPFNEGATGDRAAFAVHGSTPDYTSVKPTAGLSVSATYIATNGINITPSASAAMEYELGNNGVAATLYAADGTYFRSSHVNLDPLDAKLSAGISAGKDNMALFSNVYSRIAGNWNDTTVEVGLKVAF